MCHRYPLSAPCFSSYTHSWCISYGGSPWIPDSRSCWWFAGIWSCTTNRHWWARWTIHLVQLCFEDVRKWMMDNWLRPNTSKTEVIWSGSTRHSSNCSLDCNVFIIWWTNQTGRQSLKPWTHPWLRSHFWETYIGIGEFLLLPSQTVTNDQKGSNTGFLPCVNTSSCDISPLYVCNCM